MEVSDKAAPYRRKLTVANNPCINQILMDPRIQVELNTSEILNKINGL